MKPHDSYKKLSICVATVACVGALPVYSQEKQAGFQFEEIIVTARKIQESVQDTPLAVTAITGDQLEEKGIEQITSVANTAPNVNFSFGGTGSGSDSAAVIFIRGVGQNDFTLVTDPGVGLYVDDVYYSRTVGSVLDVFDLERIEVLRGPQGTLFGRNSTGGAISLTSRDPGDETGGSVKVTLGDEGRQELFASFGLVVNDELGFVVSGLTRDRDGSATDASGRELGDDNLNGARIKGVWTPSDTFSLKVSADYVDEAEGSAAEVPLIRASDGSIDSATVIDSTPVTEEQGASINDQEAMGISAVVEWDIGDSLSLKSVTAYRDLDATFARTPASGAGFSSVDAYQHEQFSQEVQLIGTISALDYVVGAFYLSEEGDNVGLIDVGAAPVGFPRFIGVDAVENTNYAIFAEGTWNLSEKTRLITGVRYTDEEKEASFVSRTIPGVTRGTTAADASVNFLGFSGLQPLEFSETTYRLIAQHDFTDSITSYVSVSTGFKSGGFQQRLVGGAEGEFLTPDTFEPESVDAYEIGVKADFDNIRVNVAAFSTDYTDLQISGAPAGEIATQTFNGGEASIDGLEVEFTWIPTPSFLVDFSLGLLDASYDRIDGTGTEISVDDELIRSPDVSLSLGASYNWDLSSGASIKSRIDITNKGETHFEPNNSIASFEDGYTNLDFNVAYTTASEAWTVRLGVNNVTDEEYLVAGDANTALDYDLGVFARPRNVYVSAKVNF